ncbi:MAG: ABC transporter ATP-binding protein [Anaerolineales bacterium]|nr:ABC transporter ATP-binding protein [Anaerolineales bacterium]
MKTASLLKFDRITFCYPSASRPVMKDFNLDIEAGTITAILGPNGAGKTTLLHLALGWLKPQGGNIHLEQANINSYSRRNLGQWMGLVPQNEHVAFEYSLMEFVLLGRAPYLPPLAMPGDEDRTIAAEALRLVGLSAMQDKSILGISGGERQLVLMARALAQKPRLLLLDEPTSHLDLSNKGRLVHLLRELASKGVTILFTTHEPDVASALATHLVLMQKGQILKTGTLEEVFSKRDLSRLYQLPVNVIEVEGRKVAIWI